jgi:hypothetical protein
MQTEGLRRAEMVRYHQFEMNLAGLSLSEKDQESVDFAVGFLRNGLASYMYSYA